MKGDRSVTVRTYIYTSLVMIAIYIAIFARNADHSPNHRSSAVIVAGELVMLLLALALRKWRSDNVIIIELFEALSLPFIIAFYWYISGGDSVIRHGRWIGVFCGIYLIGVIVSNMVARQRIRWNYAKKVLAISLFNTRKLITWTFCSLFLLTLTCDSVFSGRLSEMPENDLVTWSEERTIAANYDECKALISDSEYQQLDYSEKMHLFCTAVEIEGNYLGVPFKITVEDGETREYVAANYSHRKHTITVNGDYLSNCSPDELIDTAAHETYHAYQHELIELYSVSTDRERVLLGDKFLHVEEYLKDLRNYKSADDVEEYYAQTLETDAMAYADRSVEAWHIRLDELASQDE